MTEMFGKEKPKKKGIGDDVLDVLYVVKNIENQLTELKNEVKILPRRMPILRPKFDNTIALSNRKSLVGSPNFKLYSYLFFNRSTEKYMIAQSIAGEAREAMNLLDAVMKRDGYNPADWYAELGSEMEVDCIFPKTQALPTPDVAAQPIFAETQKFIHCLRYSHDNFTETEEEKAVLSSIIKRVETKYAEKLTR